MSRKDRKEASVNYISLTFAFIALGLIAVAGILPYWVTFPADYNIGWIARQWGLLKVSGKYTNLLMTGADITWIQLRDTVCGASAAFTTGSAGSSSVGMASALGNMAVGVTCSPTCKQHVTDRCMMYYKAFYINFGVFGLLVAGALVVLIGSSMPLIGKERKKDKTTWLLVDLVGFIMVAGACAAHYFFHQNMFTTFRMTSWFQKDAMGVCFILAAGAAVMLLIPVVVQMYKVMTIPVKKPEVASQLLTSGASPDFLMPSAI